MDLKFGEYIAGERMKEKQLQYFKRVLGRHFSTNSLVFRIV
jgi:hypothetical protein